MMMMTDMNQQCKVCGEPAAGFHFGAFTCEGCKSFFGRSYNNLSSISECKNNGECVINKKNRTSCKACRLRKCLYVGMSKSGSRYGRRSNWFKIHCLLQEQQQQAAAAANQQQQMQRQKTPPPSQQALAGLNSHHASLQLAVAFQQQALGRTTTKEDLMMLGLEDYKNATSPSISSPESHNSDSSVEVSDARLASRGLFKTVSCNEQQAPRDITFPIPFSPFPMFPQGFPLAAFPQHPPMPNSFLFPTGYLYPPPPTKSSLSSSSFIKQSRYPANIINNMNNNNNPPRDTSEVFNKRFYLDAILKSQRSPTIREEERDDASCSTRTPSPEIIQDNPIDLSMKRSRKINITSENSVSKTHNTSGDEGTDRDEELDEDVTVDEDISSADESCVKIPQVRTAPIDLTTKV